ncbi:unnamed protein product [Diatraea saccharalis]|uniref:Gloverin n=1 Tax=Diatraea saccharalis TaxID=40085 RepID=A0A9N9WHW4_9NEOP|nr:unnamed protein product [Diatraea saccharalis]
MQALIAFAVVFVAATAQEYDHHPYEILFNNYELIPESYVDPQVGLRYRRDVTIDHKTDNGRVFGTLGQNDDGLFGRAGVERNIFNDARGRLDAQAHGTRTIGPMGGSSALGGSLNWRNDNAAASFDVSKQIHGPTSWSAAGGGRWPVGKNGDFGVDGTYSRFGGMKDYGARGVFNYRW